MSNSTITSSPSTSSQVSLPTTTSDTGDSAPTTTAPTSDDSDPTTTPPPSSTNDDSSGTTPPSSNNFDTTFFETSTASSAPESTAFITSISTVEPTRPGETGGPVTITVTSVSSGVPPPATSNTSSTTSSDSESATTEPASLSNNGSKNSNGGDGGLSTGGKTAIAVVVPVVVVALLVLAALLLWRKRKQKKAAEEQRRKEVEDYGFNPNNDPTLPAVASESPEMAEDHSSGYRGWGAATASNRKASTTLSGGHTHGQLSDAGSNPYGPPHSPGETQSNDPLMNRPDTTHGDELGDLGAAPVAGAAAGAGAMRRGPSNASSRYSNGAHSEGSDEPVPQIPPQSYEAYNPMGIGMANGGGYGQHGPYGDGSYGGAAQDAGMPIVRDVSARRNTRIQQGGTYQQGNSGIAQNF